MRGASTADSFEWQATPSPPSHKAMENTNGIVSTPSPTVLSELGSGLPFDCAWGSPEFTSFFNPAYAGKLRNAGFYFAMTIRANKYAFI